MRFSTARKIPLQLMSLLVAWCATAALAAGPMYWDWPRGRDFDELEHRGTTINAEGYLARGLVSRQVGPAGPEVIWSLAPDGRGGCLAGSGHGGGLFSLDAGLDKLLLAQVKGPDIFCTLVRDDGEILVGTGSEGGLYSVNAEGEASLLGQVEGGYVWGLVEDPRTRDVWVATGSPAALYRLGGDAKLERICHLEAQNALTVALSPEGRLLVGTQGPGLLCSLDPANPADLEVVFQAPQDEIRHILPGPEGRLHLLALNNVDDDQGGAALPGSGPGTVPSAMMDLFEVTAEPGVSRSALYVRSGPGRWGEFWSGDLDLMMVAWSEERGWVAGGPLDKGSGESVVHRLLPPAGHHPLASWPGGDILDLLILPGKGDHAGSVLVAQAHPGSIRQLGDLKGLEAVATSPPLDAGGPVSWGRLSWVGDFAADGPRWSVRTGNQRSLGQGWSEWSDWFSGKDMALDVPESRFLQWRVALPQSESVVTAVSVSAWQENVAPVVSDLTLEQVVDISLGGMMAGGENITQTFRSGMKAEFSKSSGRSLSAGPRRAAETRPLLVFSWRGRDANDDRLTYSLQYRPAHGGTWRDAVTSTQETLGSWDTSLVPDGSYRVRVVAHDGLDNPDHLRREAETGLGPLEVDNTAPQLSEVRLVPTETGFRLEFSAEDAGSNLASATLTLPDGGVERLDPVDLICDSRQEKFRVDVPWPRPQSPAGDGVWRVSVEVRDLAGNAGVRQAFLTRNK